MPDWKNPLELLQDSIFLTKLVHACFGCAIWEFLTHLHYEWDVYRGKKQYRWTIWLYTSCRLSMLLAFIFNVIVINGGHHCMSVYVAGFVSAYASMGLASLLIVLRITAIWQRKAVVVWVSYVVWLSSIALNLHDLTLLQVSYDASQRACLPYNTHSFLLNCVGTLGSDAVLLLLMLAGILRVRRDALRDGISRVLFHQGFIWLIVALVVEVPVVVFAILDLNDPLISMFQPVELLCLDFCAARMYRELMNYAYEPDISVPLTSLNRNPRQRLQAIVRDSYNCTTI